MKKVIFILIIMVFLLSNSVIAGFSPSMERFIKEDKDVRLLIKEDLDIIILTPLEDVEISDLRGNESIKLEKDETYLLSTGSFGISWKVQVFATHESSKAESVKEQLIEDGYKKVKIIKADRWYKVQVGPFSRDTAGEISGRLEDEGWKTWLFLEDKEKNNQQIKIFKSFNELVFRGKYIILKGKVSLNQGVYPGQLEFVNSGSGGIDVYNTVDFTNLLAGILSNELPTSDRVLLPALKAKAVIARTNLFYKIFNSKGSLILPSYQGTGRVDNLINQGIHLTRGQILKYYGELVEINAPVHFNAGELERDYPQLLEEIYQQFYPEGMELVDLSKIVQEKNTVEAEVSWGLKYEEIRQLTWWGPRVITVLDLDLNRKGFAVRPVLAGEGVSGMADLADMVNNEGALAGINGGFFHYTGRPLGLFMINGQVISEPIANRTALGINEEGKVFIDRVDWQGLVLDSQGNQRLRVTGVNRKPGENEIVIINKYYGDRAPALKAGITELVVSRGKLREINRREDGQESSIPDSGFILQAHGEARLRLEDFQIGESLLFENDFTPDWDEKGVVTGLGAGPTLIKDGEVFITSAVEEFQSDITSGRAPRSALGLTADNHLVMVTIDGRQPGFSIGISLEEMAEFMLNYGVVAGMNLDGGGSARMVVRGYTMNNPSDKRLISNAILISGS